MNQKNDITLEFPKPRDAWDALSMKEKAEMIGVAVRNGITNLNDIRDRYNEFAEGGSVDTDWSYNSWKRQIAEHMGIRPDEDNTYDYEAYFNKYPEEAWKMLKGDPTAHFTDEFKTVYHPTFSSKSIGNDGSIYSGVRNPKTNPQGLVGGTWSPDYHTFTMSPDGYRGPVSMDDRKWYLENAEDNGVQLREADGSLPIYDGVPWGGVLPNVTIYGSKHSLGGPLVEAAMNEYRKGGSIHISPSKKGTFTAAAKKHGKSVQAFASQVLAHPENYSPAMRKKANFARNSRKWKHALGGNIFSGEENHNQQMQLGPKYWTDQTVYHDWQNSTIDGGTLPEVIVSPINDASWLFSTGKYVHNPRKPLADDHAKKVVSNYLSKYDNENAEKYNARISRLADVLDIRGVQFIKNNASGRLKGRAHYIDNSETAYIDDMNDIFAEVAHPWQYAKGNNTIEEEVNAGRYDADNDPRGGTRYAYPDTFEGETHGFFEPALTEWIESGKISRSLPILNKELSKQKIIPKNKTEVADSAVSWNRQAIDRRVISMPSQLPLWERIKYNFADFPLLKKHGLGGNLFDGTSQPSQKMDIAVPDATYVASTPLFHPISRKEYDWEDAALHRTNQVYSNYDEAKDEPLSLGNTLFRNGLRWIKDNIYEDFPSGVSNCTLSATQWVDPQTPVKGAKSIHMNPERFNYTAIDSAEVVPGNLIISKVPDKDSYHTMMVTGFAGQDSTVNFRGKNYSVKKGEPLMTYSRGGHDASFIQRNIPLSVYTANSDGHTQNLFYRHNYPREVFLPEIIITPNKKKK